MEGGEAGRFLGRIEGIGWLLRKNRIENGSRADPSGSNPHSYGDSFSVSGAIWASQKFIVVSAALSRKDSESINVSVLLLFSGLIPDFKDWKSVVMSILEEQDPHQYMDM